MMIVISDKTQCCGCAACASACPADCIEMIPDEEGFLYPVVDERLCTSCDLCERVCPVLQNEPERERLQKAYLVQHKDAEVLLRSTSGGAFTSIAESVLDCGGVVFGAAFDGCLRVRHVSVETTNDLRMLRNSKYVQSEIGDAFVASERLLRQGRTVCFSGTPCQIEGLQRYLRKDYPNLITVDVVCRAVPSPMVFQRYLTWQAARVDDGMAIGGVVFRDKTRFGYKYSSMSIYSDMDAMNRVYAQGVETDPYLRAFFSNICDRPSCYQCSFKKRYRESDLTLWDCFDVNRLAPELDNNGGVTRVLAHSERGEAAMQRATNRAKCIQIDADTAVVGVREMFHSVSMNERRAEFFDDCRTLSDAELFSKWFGDTSRVKLERIARRGSEMLGVYQLARRFAKWVLRR